MTTAMFWRRTLAVITATAAAIALSGCSILGQMTNGISDAVDPGPGTTQDIFDIAVGDCEAEAAEGAEVSVTKTIDCAEPHDTEIYASIMLDDGDFPGDDVITAEMTEGCVTEFESFIGFSYDASIYDYSAYTPSSETWAAGDREILCVVYTLDGTQVSGTLSGAAQ